MSMWWMILLQVAATISPPSSSTLPASSAAAEPAQIIVYGRALDERRKALADCIARGCPPEEEINQSLALADQQFVAGNYKDARTTLLRATGRNARYARTLPRHVSALHIANARLAGLNGLISAERVGVIDSVDALKKGLSADDPAIMIQRLEVGDSYAKQGRLYAAIEQYRWVARQAVKARQISVEGMALFRQAVLLSAVASVQPTGTAAARAAVRAIQRRSEAEFLPYRNGTRLMAAMLASGKDKGALIDKELASLEQVPDVADPALLYEPPMDLRDAVFGAAHGDEKTQWADVGFRITREGKVSDVYTLRISDHLEPQWLDVATRSLRQRQYQPRLDLPVTDPGIFKVLRYSFISDLIVDTGSRMTVRASRRRVNVVDITSARPAKT